MFCNSNIQDFTININTENEILINSKCVSGALNRHFCLPMLVAHVPVKIMLSSICPFV
jgi:hypothetical protein